MASCDSTGASFLSGLLESSTLQRLDQVHPNERYVLLQDGSLSKALTTCRLLLAESLDTHPQRAGTPAARKYQDAGSFAFPGLVERLQRDL